MYAHIFIMFRGFQTSLVIYFSIKVEYVLCDGFESLPIQSVSAVIIFRRLSGTIRMSVSVNSTHKIQLYHYFGSFYIGGFNIPASVALDRV